MSTFAPPINDHPPDGYAPCHRHGWTQSAFSGKALAQAESLPVGMPYCEACFPHYSAIDRAAAQRQYAAAQRDKRMARHRSRVPFTAGVKPISW